MVDQPGTGEALRLQGLTARIDTEAWAGAAVDYLETRDDVDAAPDRHRRLVARRLLRPARRRVREAVRARASPGAPTTTGARCSAAASSARASARSRTTGSTCCGCGATTDLDTFIDFADDVHLDGVVEQITVPFLIAHGENDRQIPLEYAHRSYEQAVNRPKRELRVFTPEEGATEHIGLDHLPHVSTFIADWVADTFAELRADCMSSADADRELSRGLARSRRSSDAPGALSTPGHGAADPAASADRAATPAASRSQRQLDPGVDD